jgi:hypothetical protein
VCVAALVLAAPAQGSPWQRKTFAQPIYQQWAERARVPLPAGPIKLQLTDNACDGYVCSYPWEKPPRIVMFRDRDFLTRFDFYHELGHVYSYQHPELHRPFERIFRLPGGRWTWLEEEWLAMGYTWCANDPRWGLRGYPGYDYWPTLRQHRRVCRPIAERGAAERASRNLRARRPSTTKRLRRPS